MPCYLTRNEMQYDSDGSVQFRDLYAHPPLVSPPAFGERSLPDFCSYMNTPTSSASPNSLYFSRISTHGSSTDQPTSHTSTPLSSTSSLVPNNYLSSHGRTLQRRLTEIQPLTNQNFIHETPAIPKLKPDKSQRACMLCFKEKSKCEGTDPNRCTSCLKNNLYCKGPILTPDLVDLDSIHKRAALSLNLYPKTMPPLSGSFTVELRLRPLLCANPSSSEKKFTYTIPEPDDSRHTSWSEAPFDDMLDALVAVRQAPVPDTNPLYNLTHFEHLSRRFCHCMSILRCLDRCTLSCDGVGHPRITHFVFEFIYQLSLKAHTLLTMIFEEVRRCCSAKRQREQTPKLMFNLADHLGEICKEIRAFNDTLLLDGHPYLLRGFFLDADKTIADIENIAKGLRVEEFNFANRSAPLHFGGLIIIPHLTPAAATIHSIETLATVVSFLDVIADSPPTEDFTSAISLQASINGYPNDTAEVNHSPDPSTIWMEDDAINNWTAKNQWGTFAGAENTPDVDWGASPNLEWACAPDASMSMLDKPFLEPQLSDLFRETILDPAHLQSSAVSGARPLSRNAFPPEASTSDTITDFQATAGLVEPTTTLNHVLRANSHASSMPSQKPSKRKKISTLLSRKKQRVPSRGWTEIDTDGNPDTQTMSKRRTITNAGASSTLTQIARSLSKLVMFNNVCRPRVIETDWVTSWDNPGTKDTSMQNICVMKDVNTPVSQRRPVSWPLRQHFRNSLDISIAALRNLRTDEEHQL